MSSKKINSLIPIHSAICNYFNVDYIYPFKKTTKRDVVYMRQLFHYISREKSNRNIFSLNNIANYMNDIFEPVKHSTVIHSCNKIKGYMTYDKQVQKDVNEIIKIIYKNINN